MAAYAAVISLRHTLFRLLDPSRIFTIPHETQASLSTLHNELGSMLDVLKTLDSSSGSSRSSERVSAVDGRIRDAVHKLEDEIESQVSDLLLLQSEGRPLTISINEEKLSLDIDLFNKMKGEYIQELSRANRSLPEKGDLAGGGSGGGGGEKKTNMVGLSVEYNELKDRVIGGEPFNYRVVTLVGMGGIGKTALAKELYEDPQILTYFEHQVWVTVGPKYQSEEIVQRIVDAGEDSKVMYRRYLIVVDDIWDTQIWDKLGKLFPKFRNGSRVLITTRLNNVAEHVSKATIWVSFQTKIGDFPRIHIHQIRMRLMDQEESWCLFRERVFGEELCSHQLEEVGKKIVEKCEGLPLTIVTVGALLFKNPKTVEYWSKLATQKRSSIFEEAYDQISKVLISSYHHLPQDLKIYFLYMGVFPQNYEIPTSKLINLWTVEGFVDTNHNPTPTFLHLEFLACHKTVGKNYQFGRDFVLECLDKLVSNNVLMIYQSRYNNSIKTCILHSAFWQLCLRVARENKFFHVLNCCGDSLEEIIEGHRRLCIHNNVLFGIKEAHESMASISATHSLLCTGQYHQYPVPLCLGLRLLRVLDALTIRFYDFPMEVLNLVHLRYLALTYNGNIPASISKLCNLIVLIVNRHLRIWSPEHLSYLPVEIWHMKGLKHLQIIGSNLPDPKGGALLEELEKLLDVRPCCCTKEVLGNIPRLKKLGIRIESQPDVIALSSCFDNLSDLRSLESVECVFVTPIFTSILVNSSRALLSKFPSCLKKLSLSGFGFKWKRMSKIAASLPNLEVLKLRGYAFQGPRWKIKENQFDKLKYLLIEDTDLVKWRRSHRFQCFPRLECLIIRHCYKLKKIPCVCECSYLRKIEVADSHPSVVTWAKRELEVIKRSNEQHNALHQSQKVDPILKVKEFTFN